MSIITNRVSGTALLALQDRFPLLCEQDFQNPIFSNSNQCIFVVKLGGSARCSVCMYVHPSADYVVGWTTLSASRPGPLGRRRWQRGLWPLLDCREGPGSDHTVCRRVYLQAMLLYVIFSAIKIFMDAHANLVSKLYQHDIYVVGIWWNPRLDFMKCLGIPWHAGNAWNLRRNMPLTANDWKF